MVNLHIRTFVARQDGDYHFQGLNPTIDYELRAKYRGSSSKTRTLSRLDSGKDASIDLVIAIKEQSGKENSKNEQP